MYTSFPVKYPLFLSDFIINVYKFSCKVPVILVAF